MLQRVQTLYFLGALILSVALLCVNVGRFVDANGMAYPFACDAWWPLVALPVVVALLQVCAILLYHHRMLQIRVTIFSALLMLAWYGFYVWHGLYTHSVLDATENYVADVSFMTEWTAALPLVAIVLLVAGGRAVFRDEIVVRSYDRLR